MLKDAYKVLDLEIAGIQAVRSHLNKSFEQTVAAILSSKGRVVITGIGKSGIIGQKIAATLSSTGTAAFFLHPSEAYHGDLGLLRPEDFVIAISYSGETSELLKLLSFFKKNGNKVLAMTSSESSTLSRHSDFFISTCIPKEACSLELAPTTSTTATLALGDALAVSLMKSKNFKEENFARLHPGGSLGRKLLNSVRDQMKTDNLPIVDKDCSFKDLIGVMNKGKLGICVVGSEAIGVITDGDLRRAFSKHAKDIFNKTAENIMSASPIRVDADMKLVDAEKLMLDKKISNLLVVEESKLVGILNGYEI